MMIGYLIVTVAVLGTGYAAYRDLLTTEVSDSISFLTVETGLLLHTVNSYMAGEIPAMVAGVFGVYLAGMAVWTLLSYVKMRRSTEEREEGIPLVATEEVALVVFIVAVAVVRFSLGGVSTLWVAVMSGLALFAFGQVLYHLHIWGGADSRIMGAMGFALPYLPAGFEPMVMAPWAFQVTLVLNLFLIGAVYVLGFAFYRGLMEEGVMERFFDEVRGDWRRLTGIVAGYLALMAILMATMGSGTARSVLPILTSYAVLLVGMLVLYRYLRIVEAEAMTDTVAVDDLEEGDVIEESIEVEGEVQRHQSMLGKVLARVRAINPIGVIDPYLGRLEESLGYPEIVGLTSKEIEKIREDREEVTVRTGVRFVPAFPVAILVSVLVGDIVYLGLSLLVG